MIDTLQDYSPMRQHRVKFRTLTDIVPFLIVFGFPRPLSAIGMSDGWLISMSINAANSAPSSISRAW